MEYYVVLEDNGRIRQYNIFNHTRVSEGIEELKELYLKENISREEIIDKLDRIFKYCFWAKCEYEVIISQWPNPKEIPGEKKDVYYQLEKNIPIIADSLISEWSE